MNVSFTQRESRPLRSPRKPWRSQKGEIYLAHSGDPLTDIDALRNVQFVMKNGMVFKKDGVMTPEKFFHPGPVRTPNGRWTR
jgi:hypothetical protein